MSGLFDARKQHRIIVVWAWTEHYDLRTRRAMA